MEFPVSPPSKKATVSFACVLITAILYPALMMLSFYVGRISTSLLRRIRNVEYATQGSSFISTLGMTVHSRPYQPYLRSSGLLDNSTDLVKNYDGSAVAIIHQYDRDGELGHIVNQKAKEMLEKWIHSKNLRSNN